MKTPMNDGCKIVFLVPFFGKLPGYFPFWAQSCAVNYQHAKWYVYNDTVEKQYDLNPAVTLVPLTFQEMREDFKQYFAMDVADNLRKVCDYRLLFYFIRKDKEDLSSFDYIGYTDIDMIYGKIHDFLPNTENQYAIISGNDDNLCGPFTLMHKNQINRLIEYNNIKHIMEYEKHISFDESKEMLQLMSEGENVFCTAEKIQPQRSKGFNYRKNFCIWNQDGCIQVFDNRFHKKEGAIYHFSRYKDKSRFKVKQIDLNKENFAVYKYGITPVRSQATVLLMRLSLLY